MFKDSSKPESAAPRYGPISAILITFVAYFLGSQLVLAIMLSIYSTATGSTTDNAIDYFQDATVGQFFSNVGAYTGMFITVYLFYALAQG